jgi:hypothetical protein
MRSGARAKIRRGRTSARATAVCVGRRSRIAEHLSFLRDAPVLGKNASRFSRPPSLGFACRQRSRMRAGNEGHPCTS